MEDSPMLKGKRTPRGRYCDFASCSVKRGEGLEKYRCCWGCPDKGMCRYPCDGKRTCKSRATLEVILWKTIAGEREDAP